MGTPSRDRDEEKTKRFRQRWCKHRDQRNHGRVEGGRARQRETVEETEADKVSELLFLQGPRWNV